MKRKTTFILAASIAAGGAAIETPLAQAVPVTGVYIEDPRCDVLPNFTLSHELGEVGFFPINEAFLVNVSPATFTVCVPDDNIANDWIVDILNISGTAWANLYFVADAGMTVGNADGSVIDVLNAPLPGVPPFPPIFHTPGVFAGSSPIVIPPVNTASILATPVPEPTTWGVLAVGAVGLFLRRPRKTANAVNVTSRNS
jgi:hypothetical protein